MNRHTSRNFRKSARPVKLRTSRPRPLSVSLCRFGSAAALCGALLAGAAHGASYYWDADGSPTGNTTAGVTIGGSGTWNGTLPLWWDGVSSDVVWPGSFGDSAIFGGNQGLITLSTGVSAGALVFNTAGYNLVGTGTSILTLGDTSVAGSGKIQVDNTGTTTISAGIAGNNGLAVSSSTTGTLVLSSANTYSGGTVINSGTLSIYSDANLGAASGAVTFAGATGGLTLNGPVTLGAGRQIILNNTAAMTLASSAAAAEVVLGQVTGTGTLNVSNAGTTYLLNAANNYTGILAVQSGTVSTTSLVDTASVGSGNIRLGNGTTASGLQWAPGAVGSLTLSNRQIELAGTSGGATLDSSATAAGSSITINTDLLASGVGPKSLTLTGINTGTNTFAGKIVDSSSGATGLVKSGMDLWVLSNTNNTFTGAVQINPSGVLRVTTAGALGSGTFAFGTGGSEGLELRVDASTTFNRSMSQNQSNSSATFIYLDHALGSTAANGVHQLGVINQVNGTAAFSIVGDHGYGLTTGVNNLKGGQGFTFNTFLGAPGYGAAGYQAGLLTIAGLLGDSTAGTTGLTMGGWGDIVMGPISSPGGAATPVNFTKSSLGMLTFSGSNAGWTNGVFTISGGTARVSSAPAGGASVTLGTALLELRNDTGTNFGFNLGSFTSTASTLLIDRAIGGTGSNQTATIGTIASATNSAVLTIVSDHGYSLLTGGVTAGSGITIANYTGTPGYTAYAPTLLTIPTITNSTGVAGSVTLSGLGDFNNFGTGTIFNTGGGTLNLTKSSIGAMTISGDNSGWTAGTLTAGGGTTTLNVTNLSAIGLANLAVSGGGLLEIRSNSGTSGSNWTGKTLTTGSGTIALDPLAGSSQAGQTVNFGGLVGSGSALTLITSHGYNTIFNQLSTAGAVAITVSNAGNGLVTYAGGFTSTAATSAYTFSGPGEHLLSGNVVDGTGKTSVGKSGVGLLTLSGTNTFLGNFSNTAGVTRLTTATPWGTGAGAGTIALNGNGPGTSGLDIRLDASADLAGTGRQFAASWNSVINVDRAVNGTGSNNLIILPGGLMLNNSGWGMTFTGANGYSLQFGSATNTTAIQIGDKSTQTLANYIPNINGNGSVTFASGLGFLNTANDSGITLTGTGDYYLSGKITAASAQVSKSTLTKSSVGTLVISGDNSTSFNTVTSGTPVSASILTLTAGITRVTTAKSLGGANTTLSLNAATATGAVLDLRSDGDMSFANSTLAIGTSNNGLINVDRATTAGTGGTDTFKQVNVGASTLYTTGGSLSGGKAYNLAFITLNQTGASTLVNNMSSGSSLNIGTITGGQALTFNGAGTTNIAGVPVNVGAITKNGTGTVVFSEPTGSANNVTGALVVNAGTLVADYSSGPDNAIFSSSSTLTFGGAGGVGSGTLKVLGGNLGVTLGLGALTINPGLATINLDPGTGSSTAISTGAVTSTALGGQLFVNNPTGTTATLGTAYGAPDNTIAALSGRLVVYNGTSYSWVANGASAGAFVTAYTAFNNISGATITAANTLHDSIDSGVANQQTVWGASVATNSLFINSNSTGQSLALGAFNLILNNGGLLYTGSTSFTIGNTSTTTGLKSALAGTNTDLIINNYGTGAGKLIITAPIIHASGTDSLTVGGIGTTVMGNGTLGAIGTYIGTTFLNGGTLQLASNIASLGAAASNTGLSVNGGTFDINGNTLNIGSLSGGPSGIIDNTAAGAAQLTIGAGNATGTFIGAIRNTGGALTVVKAGTGAMTLGDTISGGSNLFTGNLKVTGASVLTVNSLADAAGSKVDFAVNGATLKFVGTSNLTLSNRVLDISLAGSTGAIIDSSSVMSMNGTAAVLTINSNFAPTATSGALSLTLQGSAGNIGNGSTVTGLNGNLVSVINAFNGNIGNGAAGSVALTVGGSGGWVLNGTNTYSGGTTLAGSGLVRATSNAAFGAATGLINVTGTPTIELRSDTGFTTANPISMGGSFAIVADRAIGGSGYGQVMTVGPITETASGKTLSVYNIAAFSGQVTTSNPINAYGVRIAGLNLNNGSATTIVNGVSSAGSAYFATPAAGTSVPGALVIDGITAAGALGAHALTISSAGNTSSIGIITGDIVQGTGTTLSLVYSGGSLLTLSGQTAATNFSGGVTLGAGGSSSVLRVTTPYGLGSGAITFAGSSTTASNNSGALEFRMDSGFSTSANVIMAATGSASTGKIWVGEALNGTGGRNNSFAFGNLVFQGITGNTLTLAGAGGSAQNNGNSISFAGVQLTSGVSGGVTNNLLQPGALTLGNVTNSSTTAGTQTFTIAGSGVTTLLDATDSATAGALTSIAYNGTGVLDLSRATAANTYTGGLVVGTGGGVVRVTNQYGLGANTGVAATSSPVTLNGGTLELRSESNVSYSNTFLINATGTLGGINIAGAAGITYNLGLLKVTTASKNPTIGGIGSSLAGNGSTVNFNGVDLNGLGGTIITNNLQLPSVINFGNVTSASGSAAVTLNLNGNGTSTLGDVTNGTSTGVGITNSGGGFVDLSRMTSATNYTGGLVLSGGTTRVANAYGLGGSANTVTLNGGTLELRSDTNLSFTQNMISTNTTSGTGAGVITLGPLPGGTGTTGTTGVLFTLGNFKVGASGKTMTVAGIGATGANNADSLTIGTLDLANLAAYGINNNLNLPGMLTLGSVTSNVPAATAGVAGTLTIGGTGFTAMTDVVNGTGGTSAAAVGLAYSGSGILQITGTTANLYTGGLSLSGTGTLRTIGANSFGASTNAISLTNGTFDVRNDANLTVANPITINTNNVTINAEQATSGNLSKTLTFSNTTTLGATAKTLTLTSGSNYGITFAGFNDTVTAWAITNNASGTVNLGNINYSGTGAGALTLSGNGVTATGNITGSTAALALTYSGTGLLDLTGNNGASNAMSGLTISTAGAMVKAAAKANLGANNSTVTFTTTTAATLLVRTDNGGTSNGTVAFGNNIALNAAGANAIVDVANAGGSATGNTIAFGSLNNNAGANVGTLTVNGANGYGASFTGINLPSSTGNNTTIVANVPVTITGAVTNNLAAPLAGHWDTLLLDGLVGGTIQGAITDAATATLGNGDTRITKNGFGTWTLAGTGSTYLGPTQINLGTLKVGATNGISTNSAVTVTATGAGQTATLDLNGFSQTLAQTLSLGGSTATSTPLVLLGNGTLTLSNATSALTFTSTNNPLAALISTSGTGKVQLGVANAVITGTHSTTNAVSASNPYGADLIISAPVSDTGFGGLTKTGTSVLQLSSASNTIAGAIDIQNGTLATATALPNNANAFKLGGTTTTGVFQFIGTGGMSLSTRALTLNGTTGGGTLDNSGASTGSNAVVITPAVLFANGTAAKTLTLTGTNTDANSIGAIGNEGSFATVVNKAGLGKWTLAGANTYTGTTGITAGTLTLTGSLGNTAITVNGGTFTVNGAAANALTGTASLIVNNAASTVNINSTVNYTGVTTISNGVVNVNAGANPGLNGNTAIALSGGTLNLQSVGALSAGTLTVSAAGVLTESVANAISGTASLALSGVTVGLDKSNNYSGTTTLTNSTLNLNAANALGTSNLALSNANSVSTVNFNDFNQTIGTISIDTASGGAASQGVLNLGNATLTLTGDVTYGANGAPTVASQINGGTIDLNGATRNFAVSDSANTTADLIITSAIQNGTISKSGSGSLYFSGGITAPASGTLLALAASSGSLLTSGNITATANQAFTNAATSGLVSVAGRLNLGSKDLSLSGGGAFQLLNTAAGAGANSLSGNIAVTGSTLEAYTIAAGAATGLVSSTGATALTGSSSIGTATVALSGTSPVLRLAPVLGSSLAGGVTQGLLGKSYTGSLTTLGATNFLGATQNITTASGGFAYLNNLGGNGGVVANLPTVAASAAYPLTSSFQFTGLLNIATPGVYTFSTTSDDQGILVIDGNVWNTNNTTATMSVYLTAGLHVFNDRMNNNGGSGTNSVRYQGADTANVLIDVPASALYRANNSADLATTFTNNVTIAAGSSATLDIGTDTLVSGTLSTVGAGTGTTLLVNGSGNLNTLTLSAINLTTDLTIGNASIATAGIVLGGTVTNTTTTPVTLTLSGQAFGGFVASGNITDGTGGGTVAVTKAATGMWALSGANTYTGATTISAGTLQLGNGGTTGSLSPSSTIVNNATLAFNRTNTITQGVDFGNISGTGAVQQLGTGTTVLAGTNTYTGTTTVNFGTLNITGSTTTGAGSITVGAAAGTHGRLGLSGTISTTNILAGSNPTGAGVVSQTAGTTTVTSGDNTNVSLVLGNAAGGFGDYKLSGTGTLTAARLTLGGSGFTNSTGIYEQTGGTASFGTWSVIGHGSNTNALLDLSGGTYNAGTSFGLNHGSNSYSVVNVRGTGTLIKGSTANISLLQGNTGTVGNVGILNLLTGGTVQINAAGIGATSGTSSTGNVAVVNADGGTIYTSAASTSIVNIGGAALTANSGIYLYSGGLNIDTNGLNSTVSGALLAPTASGLSGIAVTNGGSGYISAPMIKITGGSGVGATAIANMIDDGLGQGTFKIGSVTVLSAGTGYQPTDTLTLAFGDNAGLYTTQATLGTTSFATNVSGGLTKLGNGTLTVSGANTYTGTTWIKQGTLATAAAAPNAIPGTVTLGTATTAGTFDVVNNPNIAGLLSGAGAPAANQIVGNSGTTANATLTLNGSGTYNFGGVIQNAIGAGTKTTALTMNGTGELVLSQPQTYTGGTNIQQGTVRLVGGDNRLAATGPIVLGSGTNSGKLVLGGNGVVSNLTLNQTTATSILSTSGTGMLNSIVGAVANGGDPANNVLLTLNIGAGLTDTYGGLIGWDGVGSVGFQNNINVLKNGNGTLVLSGDLSNWTGTGSGPNDPTRPTLTVAGGVLTLSGVINTAIFNTGGLINDGGYVLGPNGSIKTTGGLITVSSVTDTFASASITNQSHGVLALNFNNSGITDYQNSDMYLGAVGARIYSGTSLTTGAGNTYRFGGGAPWNAISSASLTGSGGYLQITTPNVVTGSANSVIIGDNSGGIFGGLSTVEFTTAQNFGGTLNLRGGTLVVTADNQLGSQSTVANSLLLDGGAANNGSNAVLRYGPGAIFDVSPRIGIVTGGSIDTGANNITFGTAVGNANGGTGGLNKLGTGTLTLNKANTYAGFTTVSQGTLLLDLNALGANNIIANNSAGLVMAGGNLTVKGTNGTTQLSQSFPGTQFSAGASTITPTLNLTGGTASPNLLVDFGSLTRQKGATANVNFFATNFVSSSNTALVQGAIGTGGAVIQDSGAAYMTFGTTATSVRDWAVTDATTPGRIVQAPGSFYNTTWAASPGTALPGNTNFDIGGNSPAFTPALAGDNAISTVRFDTGSAGRTLTLNNSGAGASTYSVGGILVTNAIGNQKMLINGSGVLQGANGGATDLVVHNWNGGYTTAAGGASSSTSQLLEINSVIGGTGGVTYAGAATALSYPSNTNTYTGATTINGSFVNLAASVAPATAGRLGNTSADPSFLVVNGGGLFSNSTGTVTVGRLFSIGLNGATLQAESTGIFNFAGVFNGSNAIGFAGSGARTLTLQGGGTNANVLADVLGDSGGPTSLLKQGTGLWLLGMSNNYTGATTIANGQLRLIAFGALPGGLGALAGGLGSLNTGGGNLVFTGSGTNNTVLELTAASGSFYRPLGTGFDQVQWNGNGGFAAVGADLTVNLGGALSPSPLVWGSTASFVSSGILMLGSPNATNKIAFANPLDLNGTATRTVQVDNGNAAIEAELAGALSNSGTGTSVFTKTGLGALLLSGVNNSTGLINTAVNNGYLVLANATTAVPGTSTGRTITLAANSALVLQGAADPTPLLSRINSSSVGVIALDTDSGAAIDFSDTALAGVSLGAFSSPGGKPVNFTGNITPNNNIYRFASANYAAPNGTTTGGVGQAVNILELNKFNLLNDGGAQRSVVFGGAGIAAGGTGDFYLPFANTYTGGTTIGQASTSTTSTNTVLGIGNDAALGTGVVTLTGNGGFGALNGDHIVANNLKVTSTTNNTGLGGNLASDGVTNAGAMTYLGTADLSSFTTGGIYTRSGATPAIFLGDVKTSAANPLQLATTFAIELLTTPAGAVAKTGNSGGRGFVYKDNPSGGLVIDSASSLGQVPASLNTGFFSLGGVTNATLQVLPGVTTPVVLSPNQGLTDSSGALFYFTVNGAPTLTDSTGSATSGLIGSSELVFPGVLSGSSNNTATPLNKLGYGTLTLQGKNTVTFSGTTTPMAVLAGTFKLDFANSAAGDAIFTNALGLQLGTSGSPTASTLVSPGVTVALKGKSGQTNAQTFGPITNFAKDNALVVDSNGGTVNVVTGNITNTLGGSLAVTPAAQGTITIGSGTTTTALNTSGLIVDANNNPYVTVSGTDWAARTAANLLVAGSTVSGFYTANGATSLTANSNADITSSATLGAGATVASLRFNTAGVVSLNLGGATLVTGGILEGTGAGANAQTITNGTITGTAVGGAGKNLTVYQANTASPLTIDAVIANNTSATALSIAGPGTVVLTKANSYTGVTYLNGGVLSISSVSNGGTAGQLGGASAFGNTSIVFSGGSLQYTGATASTDHGALFSAVSAIDITQSGANLSMTSTNASMQGQSGTPGILRKIGAGTLTLAGSASNGNLSVEVATGTLMLSKTSTAVAVQQSNGAALIIDSGATARVGTGAGTGQIEVNSSVVVRAGGNFDLNAVSLNFDGLAGGGSVTSATGTPTLTLGSGNDLNISAYTIAASAAGVASTGLNNFGGSITGTLALTKNGVGTQTLSGSSTYSGATTINAGTLKLATLNALPSGTSKGDVNINGNPAAIGGLVVPGTLDLGGFDQAINGLSSANGGYVTSSPTLSYNNGWGATAGTGFSTSATSGTNTLTVGNNNATASFSGVLQNGYTVVPVPGNGPALGVTGVLALTKVGSGTQTLAGLNTYTGATTVIGGTLAITGAGTLGAPTAVLTLAGGAVNLGGTSQQVGEVTISAASGNTVLQNGSLTAPSYIVNAAGDATVSANLLGVGSLNKSGAGTLTLSGLNAYSGGTNVNDGTLVLSGAGSLGSTTAPFNLNGGTLDLGGSSQQVGTLAITATSSSGTVLQNGSITAPSYNVNIAGDATISAKLLGAGALDKSGAGQLTLTGVNTYSGGTTVNVGTLAVSGAGTLGAPTASLTLAGGSVSLGGTSQQVGAVVITATSSSGTVLRNGSITATSYSVNTTGDATISANLLGAGSLTKAGPSTLTLTGNNGYTGGTNVGGGKIAFGGAQNNAGALTVAPTANAEIVASTPNTGNNPLPVAPKLLSTATLNITGGAILNLTNNGLLVDYTAATPFAAVVGLVQNGFSGGLWDGSGAGGASAITSSLVATDKVGGANGLSYMTAIGVVENNVADAQHPNAQVQTTFLGKSVDQTSVLVRYTLYGDANLDGIVDALDYSRIDSGFAMQSTATWYNGDFNYDGVIDGADYALIDTAFAFSNGVSAAPETVAQHEEQFGETYTQQMSFLASNIGPAAVPEPGSFAMLTVGGLLLGLRRRRNRRD